MSKNALVLEHHYGNDGDVKAGKILLDVPLKRFQELEKKGLVREATDEEVEAGDDLGFVSEDAAAQVSEKISFDVTGSAEFQSILAELASRDEVIADLRSKLNASEEDVASLRGDLESLRGQLANAQADHEKETVVLRKDLDEANGRAATAEAALATASETVGGDKQRQAPLNKKATDPANKAD